MIKKLTLTEFIANATHELRTPLAIMRGNIDMALLKAKSNTKMSPEKALRNINKEIDHLSGIVSTLALLTSEGGQLENRINYKTINISKLISEVVQRLRNVNHKKNITITTKIPKNIILLGDRNYLIKLFSNLIRNAITYGKQDGWIKINVLKKKNSVEIMVSDNGIGIEKKDLPYVFDRFYRADKSHSSDGKRTGLGLAISKWVTDVHRGTISVVSSIDKGSVFRISLPIKAIK